MDDTPVLNEIRKYEYKFAPGWQNILAEHIGISPQYMSDIIRGKRAVSEEVGTKFGFEKVWRRKKKNET